MELKKVRTEIDMIDEQLLALFVQRLELVEQVLEYKQSHKLPAFDPAREVERLRVATEAGGEKYAGETRRFMEQTMAVCRDYQQRKLQKERF